jgi:hypothetical protein
MLEHRCEAIATFSLPDILRHLWQEVGMVLALWGCIGLVLVIGLYFFRMPVLVLPRLFVAFSAAGVSTALSCDVGAGETEEASGSLLVALLTAFPALGPEEPAVPLMACPVERVLPAKPGAAAPPDALPAPDPAAVCAWASEVPPTSTLTMTKTHFMTRSSA